MDDIIRRTWWLLRNWREACEILLDDRQRKRYAERLGRELEEVGIPTRGLFSPALAATKIGHTFWLADQYGIRLHIGTCYGDCRAVLEKSEWKHDISPTAIPWDYGAFYLRPASEVEAIQGFSKWPEIAICQCVLNAKRAGVI